MKRIEELRNQYYEAIIYFQNEEDIRENLPSIEYENCEEILTGLIEKLEEELEKINTEIKMDQQEEIKEMLEEEKSITQLKINLCRERQKLIEKREEEDTIEDKKPITILFATNPTSKKAFIENDIKQIPKEYYDHPEICFQRILNNESEGNEAKKRKMSNNENVKELHESKDFKTRVFYRILPNNIVFIIGATFKKDDNSLKVLNFAETRKKNTNDQYQKIKEEIKNGTLNEQIIIDNQMKLEEVLAQIAEEKRGQKNGQK